MNNIIALFICLPLLASFIPMNTVQIVNNHNINRVEGIVNAAKEEARGEGYFTQDIKDEMKDQIKELGFTDDEIIINVTDTTKYRTDTFDPSQLISYKVGIKLDRLIGGNSVLGVSDEDNTTIHYVSGNVTSERLSGS